ncbi:hypothetical protein M0R19_06115 [Candidatus Pacearchaeota archaeon]|jgi:hypothetical protein|nr:hypothetical protein [Candidatus Pacearchaeota archaeon]
MVEFKYGGIDVNSLQAKRDKLSRSKGNQWAPKENENSIRILPAGSAPPLSRTFYVEYFKHYNIGQGDVTSFFCPQQIAKKPCPICDLVKNLYETKDSDDKQLANSIRAKSRFYMNIIDLKDVTKGVQIFEAGIMLFEDILSYFVNIPKYGDILNPKEGRNFTLIYTPREKSATGFAISRVQIDIDKSPIPSFKLLEKLHDFKKEVLVLNSADYLRAMLEGGDVDEDSAVDDSNDDVTFIDESDSGAEVAVEEEEFFEDETEKEIEVEEPKEEIKTKSGKTIEEMKADLKKKMGIK